MDLTYGFHMGLGGVLVGKKSVRLISVFHLVVVPPPTSSTPPRTPTSPRPSSHATTTSNATAGSRGTGGFLKMQEPTVTATETEIGHGRGHRGSSSSWRIACQEDFYGTPTFASLLLPVPLNRVVFTCFHWVLHAVGLTLIVAFLFAQKQRKQAK